MIKATTSTFRLATSVSRRLNGVSSTQALPAAPLSRLPLPFLRQLNPTHNVTTGGGSVTQVIRKYSSGNHNDDSDGNHGKRRNLSSNLKQNPRRSKTPKDGDKTKESRQDKQNVHGGDGHGNGSDGKGGSLFVDQNEHMKQIFDKLKNRLPDDMRQHFEPGSVNYHICKTLVLLMNEKYLKLLPRAIEEFDRAIELAQHRRQFSFIDTIGQSFLRDQITLHGGRRGYELILSLFTGLLHERKEPHDAIRMYNSILDMEGVIAETYYCRGICYMRGLGDYHKAKEDLQMATRIRSDFYQAYDQLGVLMGTMYMVHDSPQAQKRNRESSLRLFDQAIEINGQYAPAYTNRAMVLMEQDPYRALQDLETSIALDSLNGYTYQQLGTLYMDHLKKLDKALECFNRAIQLQPHNPSLYQFRAMLYQKMKLMSEVDRDLLTSQEMYQDLQRDATVSRHY